MLSLSRTAFRAASSASRRMFSSEVKKIGVVGKYFYYMTTYSICI